MNNIVTQRFIKCHDKLREDNRVRSSRQFALSLDYLPQSLSEILKGRRDVTIELLRKAVEQYKINPVYVFTGEGPMFMSEEEHQDFRVLTIVTNAQEEERIVHVPGAAQIGYASDLDDPNFIQQLPSFTLPDYKYQVGTHRSFDIAGDAMDPTLREGDKVICSFLEPTLWETAIQHHFVYLIVTSGEVLVRRVRNLLKEEKALELSCDNDFYENHRVSQGEIREIWHVQGKISPFLASLPQQQRYARKELQALKETIRQQSLLLQQLHQKLDMENATTLVEQHQENNQHEESENKRQDRP